MQDASYRGTCQARYPGLRYISRAQSGTRYSDFSPNFLSTLSTLTTCTGASRRWQPVQVRVVLCHDAAECGAAAVHAAAAAAAAVLASVVVATGTSTLHSIYSHRTSTSTWRAAYPQQQRYPQQQYPQQQHYPQQLQFDPTQLHQEYQQPPLPSQQCPTPAIYTSTSHT